MQRKNKLLLLPGLLCMLFIFSCAILPVPPDPQATAVPTVNKQEAGRSPRLALWLAKKNELLSQNNATFDLVMTGWLEPSESEALRARYPGTNLLAGLSHTWVLDDPGWQTLLLTIANDGNPVGPLQITEDMYLMLDTDDDGTLDQRCSPPGWGNIHAIDPRHPGWQALVESFYKNTAKQAQHDGVIIDMVDAYPFCQGAWSEGIPDPIDEQSWVTAQAALLSIVRAQVPEDKWVIANAGHDFPEGSPFPAYLNGYLLENFLGDWGAGLEEGLASAQRALETTLPPHIVVFAVDTDDTGEIDETRFRVGLAASLLMDNTYFAYDYGSRDHGSVTDWWNPVVDEVILGEPLDMYTYTEGVYRRDFELGTVAIANDAPIEVSFGTPHRDVFSGGIASIFQIPAGEAAILITAGSNPEPAPDITLTIPPEEKISNDFPCVPQENQVEIGRLVEIIDGDTIVADIAGISYHVRYIGIDTPERGEPFYNEATAYNRQLLGGVEIILIKDVSETDKYDRLLRYVFSGGVFINYELVKNGVAQQVTFPPDVACAAFFREAEQAARGEGVGLWAQP